MIVSIARAKRKRNDLVVFMTWTDWTEETEGKFTSDDIEVTTPAPWTFLKSDMTISIAIYTPTPFPFPQFLNRAL